MASAVVDINAVVVFAVVIVAVVVVVVAVVVVDVVDGGRGIDVPRPAVCNINRS